MTMVVLSGIQDPTDDSKKPPLLKLGALLTFPPFDLAGWKAGDLKQKMHIGALSCCVTWHSNLSAPCCVTWHANL